MNGYDVTYTFDGAGNRMTKVAGGATTTYTYGAADALLVEDAAGARTTYSYDNAGNTTVAESAAGRTTYSWGGENRLTGIALPDGAVWTLSYDATGLRREKQSPAGTTRFIWDGQRLLEETDSGGTTQAHYTAGLGTYGPMLSQRRSGVSAFLQTDRLGTVRLLSDASAAAIDTYLLDAFGSLIASTGSTVNPHGYVGALGYYSEPTLALGYVRARWLRPTTGSWLSVDPVVGQKRYGYVGGRATWGVDPDGAQMGGVPYGVDTGPALAQAATTAWEYINDRLNPGTIVVIQPGETVPWYEWVLGLHYWALIAVTHPFYRVHYRRDLPTEPNPARELHVIGHGGMGDAQIGVKKADKQGAGGEVRPESFATPAGDPLFPKVTSVHLRACFQGGDDVRSDWCNAFPSSCDVEGPKGECLGPFDLPFTKP